MPMNHQQRKNNVGKSNQRNRYNINVSVRVYKYVYTYVDIRIYILMYIRIMYERVSNAKNTKQKATSPMQVTTTTIAMTLSKAVEQRH